MSDIKWLSDDKWGVFVHYLDFKQNTEKAGRIPWDEHINSLDIKKLAKQLHELNAHYFMFTLQQQTEYMSVPSKVYEDITGYRRGEVTPHRDIVFELYEELSKYGIDLMLYFTGDGPFRNDKAGNAFGYRCNNHEIPVTTEFVKKWGEVLGELSIRYKDMVKGWWIDGCHPCLTYDEEKWSILKENAKKGNPNAIVAFNASIVDRVKSFSPLDDYVAGERSWFDEIPKEPFIDGDKLWHIFTYLGYDHDTFGVHDGWGMPGCRYSGEYIYDFVKSATDRGGIVTIDVCMDRYGNFDKQQFESLKLLKNI